MFTPFSQLPPSARVWIYQASRDLQGPEIEAIETKAEKFAEVWTAHKVQLKASAIVLHNSFLVLGIDEENAGASGCSIDASVNFVKELEKEFNVMFLDRTQLAFIQNNTITHLPLKSVREAIEKDLITPATMLFNNMVQTKFELENKWIAPASETWLIKYFTPSDV